MSASDDVILDKPDSESSANQQNASAEKSPDPPLLNQPKARQRKFDPREPLDRPEDEAIAQYLSAPRSIREFKSLSDLGLRFKISRMTVYRRSKQLEVLERTQWLLRNYKLAGDLVAKLNWERIVKGQVRAAVTGDTRAAEFCKAVAWAEAPALKL